MDPSQVDWAQIATQMPGAAGHDAEGVIGNFYDVAVQDHRESEVQGRAVFKNVPHVEIRVPGQTRSVVIRAVQEKDKLRWPAAWANYLAKRTGLADGTPLEQWALLTPADVATLKSAGVFSIEQCSAMSDGVLGSVGMRAREWRERARQHLQGGPKTERELRGRLAEQDRTIASLEARLRRVEQNAAGGEAGGPHDHHDDGGIAASLEAALDEAERESKPRARRRAGAM